MSDEVTIAMARDVAIGLKKLSEGLRKEDPHGYIAGVGLMLVSVVEQRDRLRAELSASEARNTAAYGEMAELRAELAKMSAREERERMCHAGCGVIVMSNTRESLDAVTKDIHPDYMSASLRDCIRAAESEIALRAELARYREWHDAVMAEYFPMTTRPQPLTKGK